MVKVSVGIFSFILLAINTLKGMDMQSKVTNPKKYNLHGSFRFDNFFDGRYPFTVLACFKKSISDLENKKRILALLEGDLLIFSDKGTELTKKIKKLLSSHLRKRFAILDDEKIHFNYGLLKSYEDRNHYKLYFMDHDFPHCVEHYTPISSLGNYVEIEINKFDVTLGKVVKVNYKASNR